KANAFIYGLEGCVVMQKSKVESRSLFNLVKPSTKVPMTFTLSIATPAKRSRRSCSSCSLKTEVGPSCHPSKGGITDVEAHRSRLRHNTRRTLTVGRNCNEHSIAAGGDPGCGVRHLRRR